MNTLKTLSNLGIERCIECNNPVGEDWTFFPFSNKTLVVCPQCGELINIENMEI